MSLGGELTGVLQWISLTWPVNMGDHYLETASTPDSALACDNLG